MPASYLAAAAGGGQSLMAINTPGLPYVQAAGAEQQIPQQQTDINNLALNPTAALMQ